jgi:methionyl aminopeptidase
MDKEEIAKLKKAGQIAKQTRDYAKLIVKKGTPLIEIAEKLESKILELGGKPAFPVNLSINQIAAHFTPSWNDNSVANGLIKVDLGVHVDGFVADTALSIDLENSIENKQLIDSAKSALESALKIAKFGETLSNIGLSVEKSINSFKFTPIHNLSGHAIERYNLHAGLTIPNYDTKQSIKLTEGVYAIEPFSTNGIGLVKDGQPSGIYNLIKEGNVRDTFAREVLSYIIEEYESLPFCSRWIYKKFGSRGLLALKRIEDSGLIHSYPQLIEKGNGIVAQAEHTLIITKTETIISTI